MAFEDHGKAKVCVEVISPASYCPAAIPFELMLVTEPDSASKTYKWSVSGPHNIVVPSSWSGLHACDKHFDI